MKIANKSNLFCANMYLKSIESIKLQNESLSKSIDLDIFKDTKNSFNINKEKRKNNNNNSAIRNNLHKNYYDNSEKIVETLAENISES
jgi:hypothetical protein